MDRVTVEHLFDVAHGEDLFSYIETSHGNTSVGVKDARRKRFCKKGRRAKARSASITGPSSFEHFHASVVFSDKRRKTLNPKGGNIWLLPTLFRGRKMTEAWRSAARKWIPSCRCAARSTRCSTACW